MLTKLLRATVQKITLPIGRAMGALGISPNMVTILGALVTLAAAFLIADGRLRTGGFVLAAGGVMDALDGAVARGSGRITRAGAFLDSSLDRASDGVIFAAIAWHLSQTSQPIALALALTCLVLGFLTSYVRARAESLQMTCSVGIAERSERVIVVALALMLGFPLIWALGLLAVLSAITVIQRFVHVCKQATGAPLS